MDNHKILLYKKQSSEEESAGSDNPWDDALLIKAYDRAVNLTKEDLAKAEQSEVMNLNCTASSENGFVEETKSKNINQFQIKWRNGMNCRTVYSQDNKEYEAVIIKLKTRQQLARVRYIGYNNEEDVEISSLKPSLGDKVRERQIFQSLVDNGANPELDHSMNYLSHQNDVYNKDIVPPPPPPPHVLTFFPKDEQEALSAMLMAWYMSGYHTGFYQGLKAAKNKQDHRKK